MHSSLLNRQLSCAAALTPAPRTLVGSRLRHADLRSNAIAGAVSLPPPDARGRPIGVAAHGQLETLLQLFDADGDGMVTLTECIAILKELDIGLSPEQKEALIFLLQPQYYYQPLILKYVS